MALPIESVLSIVRDHITDPTQRAAIAKALQAAEKEVKSERAESAAPKAKKRFVVLIRGDATLKAAVSGGAWIVAENEGNDTNTLLSRIASAVRCSNDALKRNRATRTIKTFARAMEWLKPKAIKVASPEQPWSVKTKVPVEVLVVEQESL